jgi:exopolyphosphatase/guanosine-5'-triphosphate,3'-diphosphate pyrophosphatase
LRTAIVDQGTNSCRLLLAEVDGEHVRTVARLAAVTRLGLGVDSRRRLDPIAVARTHECIAGYARRIAEFAPHRRLLIATSVIRDAHDGRAFLDRLRVEFDLPWIVASGLEEAGFAYRGARSGAPDLTGRAVVVDIGGGSTEFAVGESGVPEWSCSLEMGVVRLTERYFAGDPPSDAEWSAAERHVAHLIGANVPAAARERVAAGIGVAGTITTLVAVKLGLAEYRPALVHGHVLALADIEAAIALFRTQTAAERALLPGIQRGREDVILAGALIARSACRAFGLAGLRASEADMLEGAALFLAGAGGPAV